MTAPAQALHDLKEEYINRTHHYPPPTPRDIALMEKDVQDAQYESDLKKQPPPQNPAPLKPANARQVATQKLDALTGTSDDVLLKVSTVWPFTFFVHDIIIDPYKVNVIFREFISSERIHSIMIKDITDIFVETSLFFATVKIVDLGFIENTVDIPYLKKEDAMQVRKIIQGLVIAQKQSIDLSALPKSDIKKQTEELGKVKGIDDNLNNGI